MLSCFEHEKSFITSGLGKSYSSSKTNCGSTFSVFVYITV